MNREEALAATADVLGEEVDELRADNLALKRAIREAKADRDALRRMLSEILVAHRSGMAPALHERAHELVTRHPFDPDHPEDSDARE